MLLITLHPIYPTRSRGFIALGPLRARPVTTPAGRGVGGELTLLSRAGEPVGEPAVCRCLRSEMPGTIGDRKHFSMHMATIKIHPMNQESYTPWQKPVWK